MDVKHKVYEPGIWGLGLYRGSSIHDLRPYAEPGPMFDVKELASFKGFAAADPFALRRDDGWYVFFECFVRNSPACIACAHSVDLISWRQLGIVLQPAHHLSYPFVFEHEGEVYMMPESYSVRRVDLYRAIEFPYRWQLEKTILRGRLHDASMVRFGSRYWIFSGWRSYWLKLFYADSPLGPWRSHWLPSIVRYGKSTTRPGGRPVVLNGELIRLAQDNVAYYGHQLRAFTVTTLNRLWYRDRPTQTDPILVPSGTGWNARNMHHADIHPQPDGNLIAFVDGSP